MQMFLRTYLLTYHKVSHSAYPPPYYVKLFYYDNSFAFHVFAY